MVSSCRGCTARTSHFYDLAYADDTTIFTGTAEHGQQILHTLPGVAAHSNLSYKKSVLLRSSTASNHIQLPTAKRMKTATQPKYLGVMLRSDSSSKTHVTTNHIGQSRQAF